MSETNSGARTLSELDYGRLSRLSDDISDELRALLEQAEIVKCSDVPIGIVTMYAQVEIEDEDAGRRLKVVLCYPEHAEPRAGYLSVLSPVGIALLGKKVGSLVHWQTREGERRSAQIVSVAISMSAWAPGDANVARKA